MILIDRRSLSFPMWPKGLSATSALFLTIAVCSGSGFAAERFPVDDKIGWYELPSSERILLEPSANGGLYAADFANFTSGVIQQDSDGGLVWTRQGEEEGRAIEFTTNAEGRVEGFRWRGENGEEGAARKLDDGPYNVEEVTFESQGNILSGTLYVPNDGGPHPGVVFIHGSGASNRDNLWYQAIVHRIVKSGAVVLLPDKRGTGKSEGDWTVASFADFAEDTLAGVALVRKRSEVNPDQVGLVGISQGGWIAPLTASMSPNVAFVVNVSGTTVKPNEQLLHELGGGKTGEVRAKLAKMRRPEWWEKNGEFDSIPYWRELDVPGLIVYGEEDEEDNVPVQRSVELIKENVPESNPTTVKVFEDTGHGMWDKETRRIREDFLELVTTWIHEAVETSGNT